MATHITIEACEQLVRAATSHCSTVQVAPTTVPQQAAAAPDWGGVTFALTALSAAFVLGSIIVAILAVIGGYAWGKMIARDAEEEARRIAKEVAEAQIQDWIANEGPRFMADSLALIMPLDDENKAKGEADAAKAIGEVA